MADIDQTSLAASSIERRDSLEKHLQHRPDPEDLRSRHILVDTNMAPSSATAFPGTLERRRTSDSLQRHLEQRPEREELVERNILPSVNAAPALQAQARELEKHMRADSLEQKIQNRPQPEMLIAQGILDESEDPRSPTY
jgi:hypothetical protein